MKMSEVLNLKTQNPITDKDGYTIASYLTLLLKTLIKEKECFSGKRPFGNSGWEYDLYLPLVKAGIVDGEIDEDGYIDQIDTDQAENLLLSLVESVFINGSLSKNAD